MQERRKHNRRELDKLGEAVIDLEKNKVSFKLFISAIGGFGLLLSLILGSTIALHIAFSDFKIDVIDRITCVDKNVEKKIAEIKIEIANIGNDKYVKRSIRWEDFKKSR